MWFRRSGKLEEINAWSCENFELSRTVSDGSDEMVVDGDSETWSGVPEE